MFISHFWKIKTPQVKDKRRWLTCITWPVKLTNLNTTRSFIKSLVKEFMNLSPGLRKLKNSMRGIGSFHACVHTGILSDWNRCMAANFSFVCIVLNTNTLFKSGSSLKWCTWPIVFNEYTSTTS